MLNEMSFPVQIRMPPPSPWTVPPRRRATDGLDGRLTAALLWQLSIAAFDEMDQGVVMLAAEPCDAAGGARVLHVNHVARTELGDTHPLLLVGDELHARRAHDAATLHDAVRNAQQRGLRRLLTFEGATVPASVSVVPLPGAAGGRCAVLLMLGKQRVCEELTVQGYATGRGLTPAVSRVLAKLCRGQRPDQIAAESGVRISTVRTQIGSIRLKTGAGSIGALVRQVSVLPPLMGVLRSAACRHAA